MIGLGEAGGAIASGLAEQGRHVVAYDTRASEPALRRFAEESGIELVDSPTELAAKADLLVCVTSGSVAVQVAEQFAGELGERHLYSDWNSTSPRCKRDVASVVGSSGAGFADGAVMAAVPPHRHRVPVLVSGDAATRVAEVATELGMRVDVVGEQPGQASAVKMYRSLLVKGLEALVLECTLGAERHGVAERVLTSMNGSLPYDDWEALASYLLDRTVVHGKRRAAELCEVATTLTESGIAPLLADAGAQRLRWAVDRGLRERFPGEPPADYHRVLSALADGGGG